MSTLTPNAAVLSLLAPSTSIAFGAIQRFPVFGYVSISAPSVTAVKTLTVTPSPAVVTCSAPSVVRHWSVLPSAVATLRPATNPVPSVTIFQVSPATLDQTMTPTRSVVLISAPQVLRIGGNVTISSVVPAFLDISARQVTRIAGPIALSPDPAVLTSLASSVVVDRPLSLSPDPAVLSPAVPEVNVATDRVIAPGASTTTFSAISVGAIDFGSVDLFPDPATLGHVVPSPSVLPGEKVLQPVPASLTPSVPTPVVRTTGLSFQLDALCLINREADSTCRVSVNVPALVEVM